MYKPEYFEAHEFVDRATYEKYGDRSLMFMDDRILEAVDFIRGQLEKAVTINNWMWGGGFEWSGLRTKESPWYSPYSQHSFGRAIDFRVEGMEPEDVRLWIMDMKSELFVPTDLISSIELDTPTWVHIDCRNVEPNHESGYYVFQP